MNMFPLLVCGVSMVHSCWNLSLISVTDGFVLSFS